MEEQLKEYVVTLYSHEDLEGFYEDMENRGFTPVIKRPTSRNTHYLLTDKEAEKIKNDGRVWDVIEKDSIKFIRRGIVNNSPYSVSGDFWKNVNSVIDPSYPGIIGMTADANKIQWGLLHCAGTQSQRRKNSAWGEGGTTEVVNDSVTVYNDGRHVDVVIVDDPISYDCEEWYSPTTNTSRFVQYQWFTELSEIVDNLDDDGQSPGTGTITYHQNSANNTYHGVHVTSTCAGQFYGWAREANIYNIAVTETWPSGQGYLSSLLVFDYLRAFHLNKPINPATGKRNPTITNHSYGSVVSMPVKGVDAGGNPITSLDFSDLTSVTYRGITYNSSNPGPSGWTEIGVETDFGVRFGLPYYPYWIAAVAADVQDAIKDGVVVIGAAGNDNLLIAQPGDDDWDNYLTVSQVGSFYYNRGGAPNTPDTGGIIVGALSDNNDFRRSEYTQFGPGVDLFAPGDRILGSYNNITDYIQNLYGVETGFEIFEDSKYTEGSGNWWYPIDGTSMASPQVCGIVACAATNKARFTQSDALEYLNKTAIFGEMDFNISGGGYIDYTCQKNSPNKFVGCKNIKLSTGYIETNKGERKASGQVFPRKNQLNLG